MVKCLIYSYFEILCGKQHYFSRGMMVILLVLTFCQPCVCISMVLLLRASTDYINTVVSDECFGVTLARYDSTNNAQLVPRPGRWTGEEENDDSQLLQLPLWLTFTTREGFKEPIAFAFSLCS